MAGSVNKVILVGNLGKDPESRTFANGGKVVSFSVATSENWKDRASGERKEKTEWHNVSIFSEGLADEADGNEHQVPQRPHPSSAFDAQQAPQIAA